jgi:hypothetical protein
VLWRTGSLQPSLLLRLFETLNHIHSVGLQKLHEHLCTGCCNSANDGNGNGVHCRAAEALKERARKAQFFRLTNGFAFLDSQPIANSLHDVGNNMVVSRSGGTAVRGAISSVQHSHIFSSPDRIQVLDQAEP